MVFFKFLSPGAAHALVDGSVTTNKLSVQNELSRLKVKKAHEIVFGIVLRNREKKREKKKNELI